MAFCPNCSNPVSGRFCTNCGFDIASSPSQSYQYPTLRPFPYVAVVAIVFAIISIIMIILAGALTWWEMDIDMDMEVYGENVATEMHFDYTLQEGSYEMEARGGGQIQKQDDEGDLEGDAEDVCDCTALLLLLGTVLMIVSCIFVVLMIGASRTFTMARHTRSFKILGILFALVALIVVLIAPLFYAGAWPDEMKNELEEGATDNPQYSEILKGIYDGSFAGSDTFSDTIEYSYYDIDINGESNWGPGIGWILSFLCIVFILITLTLIKVGGDQAQRMAVTTPMTTQYGYGVQQPQAYQQPPPYPQPTPQPYPQPSPQPYPQPLPLPQRPSTMPTKVTCPTCGYVIPVQVKSLPHPITCLQCGTRGFIE
jgi:hypothetical protein